jgi:hypothetical protein
MSANHLLYPKKFGVGITTTLFMTKTFTKISVAIAFVAISLGVFGFMTNTNLFISDVSAQTTCGDCGGTGGGGTGGGGTGGGSTSNPPVCNISLSAKTANIGDNFTLTWNGSPSNATFEINNYPVADKGSADYKFPAGYSSIRYVMTGVNGDGNCVKEVVIKRVTAPVAPTCDIVASVSQVAIDGKYRITWTGTPANGIFKINGEGVPATGSHTYTFVGPNTETFTFTGETSGGTCSDTVTVTKKPDTVVQPTCDITANVTSVAVGGRYTISWTGTPASAVFKINGDTVAAVGSHTYTFVGPNTETFTFTGANGDKTCTDTVVITKSTDVPPPTCELLSSKSRIVLGSSARLTWTATNAVGTATINPGAFTVFPNNSSAFRDVTPTTDTTYTMTVRNSAGVTATCSETIRVVPPTSASCDTFNAEPSTINRGQKAVLSWTTTNATNVSINNAVGTNLAADDSTEVAPLETTTYILTASKTGSTDYCERTVTVIQPTVFSCENNVNYFRASDTSIDEGDSTTLSWTTSGVSSLSITNLSSTALTGSESVSPRSDTTYTMTIRSASGATDQCEVSIDVDEDDGGSSSSSPRCDLDLSDESISRGDRVTLTWDTSYATDVIIKDNHGQTILDSDDTDDRDGEISLRPEQDTTYTLIAERGSSDRTCTVSVDVKDSITVLETRNQTPIVTGISLTQLPYTGFEAGPFLTMVFYGLLLLWALYLTYVLVIRRNSIGGVALASATPVVSTPSTPADVATSAHPAMPAATMNTPRFVSAESVAAVAPIMGYAQAAAHRDEAYDVAATKVEDAAHLERVLFSSEAMRHFIDTTTESTRMSVLATVLSQAKASYPSEDGWVVLNLERMSKMNVAAPTVAEVAPAISIFTPATVTAGNSSLAEAIVTGNIVAAYQLIGNRPMVALAEAAAELDTLYRAKQGAAVTLSQLLQTKGAEYSLEQVKAAIAALTSALDGTYTDENEAVKMAILKAIKAVN